MIDWIIDTGRVYAMLLHTNEFLSDSLLPASSSGTLQLYLMLTGLITCNLSQLNPAYSSPLAWLSTVHVLSDNEIMHIKIIIICWVTDELQNRNEWKSSSGSGLSKVTTDCRPPCMRVQFFVMRR